MPGLKTFLALDHQSLADQLARDLAPGGSREGQGNARNPFLKDIIIVDGKALSNWLTHQVIFDVAQIFLNGGGFYFWFTATLGTGCFDI